MISKPYRKSNNNSCSSSLALEELETRLMLSTVDISAYGQEGGETFSLLIDEVEVQSFTTSTQSQTFTYTTDETFSTGDVRIQFTNDLYQPEIGLDRNLVVERIVVDGDTTETTDASVYGTGTWTGSSIEPGFNQANVLHANGYFQYADNDAALTFGGYTWTRSSATTAQEANVDGGLLSLSGASNADTAIWTVVPVSGNQLYEFSVDAWRQVNQGQLEFDGQPWTTVGVDLYDPNGIFISKQEVQVFGPTEQGDNSVRTREIFTPDNAAFASIWAWAQQTPANTDIPMQVANISLEAISPGDVTPPTINLIRSPITQPTNRVQLTAHLSDDSGVVLLNTPGQELLVEGPNGYSIAISSIAGNGFENDLSLFYELPNSFNASFNGEYTVTALGNKFRDSVGNFISEGTLVGTFTVNI